MSSIDTGGPAFGQVVELKCVRVEMDGSSEWEPEAMLHGGMTLRDYFAAKALATIPAYRTEDVEAWEPRHFAAHAYAIADAMIAARTPKETDDGT